MYAVRWNICIPKDQTNRCCCCCGCGFFCFSQAWLFIFAHFRIQSVSLLSRFFPLFRYSTRSLPLSLSLHACVCLFYLFTFEIRRMQYICMYGIKSIDKILLSRLEFGIDAYKLSRQFYRTENRTTNEYSYVYIYVQLICLYTWNECLLRFDTVNEIIIIIMIEIIIASIVWHSVICDFDLLLLVCLFAFDLNAQLTKLSMASNKWLVLVLVLLLRLHMQQKMRWNQFHNGCVSVHGVKIAFGPLVAAGKLSLAFSITNLMNE